MKSIESASSYIPLESLSTPQHAACASRRNCSEFTHQPRIAISKYTLERELFCRALSKNGWPTSFATLLETGGAILQENRRWNLNLYVCTSFKFAQPAYPKQKSMLYALVVWWILLRPISNQQRAQRINTFQSQRGSFVLPESCAHTQSNRLRIAQHNFSEKLVEINCKKDLYCYKICNILDRKINHRRLK